MTPRVFSPRNGLNKIVEVNSGQGNRGLQNQQASTRVIYDSLALTAGQSYYRFFDNCSSRTFPNTNLSENKLQVNESIVVKWINFHILATAISGAGVLGVNSIASAGAQYYRADFWLEIANSMVLKPMPLEQAFPAQNRYGQHQTSESIRMTTDIVIPSLLEFVLTLRTNTTALPALITAGSYVCTMEGEATIYKPNARF